MSESRSPLICSFESRRSDEMRQLIERMGGRAFIAPSMQEVRLTENVAASAALRQFVSGNVDALILLTGVGTEAMLELAENDGLKDDVLQTMAAVPLLVRGPKPAAVLTKLGLRYTVKAPQPNTWRELMAAIQDHEISLQNKTVAVQEYGVSNPHLTSALEAAGATTLAIPVYRWALPDDIEPLQQAVRGTIAGDYDALAFTSAQQVRHVLQIAEQLNLKDEWLDAANRNVIASIGPTCSETLADEGLTVTCEASPPRMGPLARIVVGACAD